MGKAIIAAELTAMIVSIQPISVKRSKGDGCAMKCKGIGNDDNITEGRDKRHDKLDYP